MERGITVTTTHTFATSSPASYDLDEIPRIEGGPKNTALHGISSGSTLVDESQRNLRAGVRQAEAMRSLWTLKWLVAAYTVMFFIQCNIAFQQSATEVVTPRFNKELQLHGVMADVSPLSVLIGGMTVIPLALFIDVVGRSAGFLLIAGVMVLSNILMASCQGPGLLVTAQVLNWIGLTGVYYIFIVFIADTSKLSNRLIWISITTSPIYARIFFGSKIADDSVKHVDWRWVFATITVVSVVTTMIFWIMFWWISKRTHIHRVKQEASNRTCGQSVMHWFVEYDLIGVALICGGLSLTAFSFLVAAYHETKFAAPQFICMISLGSIMIISSIAWEKFASTKSFIPFHIIKDRSVVASFLLCLNGWIVFSCLRYPYTSYLSVIRQVQGPSYHHIGHVPLVVSGAWNIIMSVAFKYTNTYKWGALIAVPLQILLTGLSIHVRTPDSNLAGLIAIDVLSGFCETAIHQVQMIAIMASVPHENFAVVMALLTSLNILGGTVGNLLASSIWTQVVSKRLAAYLLTNSTLAFMNLSQDDGGTKALYWQPFEQKAYIRACDDAQRIMLICSACASIPCLAWAFMLKNQRLSPRPNEDSQRKGENGLSPGYLLRKFWGFLVKTWTLIVKE